MALRKESRGHPLRRRLVETGFGRQPRDQPRLVLLVQEPSNDVDLPPQRQAAPCLAEERFPRQLRRGLVAQKVLALLALQIESCFRREPEQRAHLIEGQLAVLEQRQLDLVSLFLAQRPCRLSRLRDRRTAHCLPAAEALS